MLADEIDDKTPSKDPATTQASPKITFSTIQTARLDKLLGDIIYVFEIESSSARAPIADVGLGSEIEKVQSLQKHWRARFKSKYFALDQYRLEHLFSNALREVSFSAIASDGLGIWSPKDPITHQLSEAEVGQKMKVLRGFRLKSMYAPVAGLRYDGLYILESWSLKLDQATEMYTMRLILERVPGQTPIDEILHIPRPSQLDDWILYEKLERERIKQTEGDARLTEWIIRRDKERIERGHWRRSRAFKSEMSLSNSRAPAAGGGGEYEFYRRRLSDINTDLVPYSEDPEGEEEEKD
ncbi:hypothetical protein SLS64_003131 [Diaporthe eres]